MKRTWMMAWAALTVLPACGGTTVVGGGGDGGAAGGGGVGGAVAQGCQSNAECAEGWCVGEPGCDSAWSCVEEIPCSAAAPFLACSCSGTVTSLAAGCPGGPYLRTIQSFDLVDEGDPCPVSLTMDVAASSPTGTIWGRVYSPSGDVVDIEQVQAADPMTMTFDDALIPGEMQWVAALIDVSSNNACDPEDTVYRRLVGAQDEPVGVTLTAMDTATCAEW